MKKSAIIPSMITFVAIIAVAISINRFTNTNNEQPLYEITQAAFITLDQKIVKCTSTKFMLDADPNSETPIAPLFDNLGDLHFAITTKYYKTQAFYSMQY